MLRIALPNKGRLAEETRDLFEDAGLDVRGRGERALTASLGGEFEALFVRAQDIPEFVADGAADAGVTGYDLVRESGRALDTLLDLEFGRCRLVVAARESLGLESLDDLAGTPRVATVFPRLTERFFAARRQPVEIVPMSGSAEIAPHIGIADVIVDLVSTGSTLRINGLVEIATICESSARLVAPASGPRDSDAATAPIGRTPEPAPVVAPTAGTRVSVAAPPMAAALRAVPAGVSVALDELVAALSSVLRARGKRYVMANVPRERLEQVRAILPGLNGPTVIDVLNGHALVAVHAVVEAQAIFRTIARLKAVGAEGILVTRIERLMP